MAVRVRVFTDPLCVWSWGVEPGIRALMAEFGEEVAFTFVMAGLARSLHPGPAEVRAWLEATAVTGMPSDPRVLMDAPPGSSYPLALAVEAATEQGPDAAYRLLRALREGSVAMGRKLDTTDALVQEARRAGLDAARFGVDLASNAAVEAFGRDLDAAAAQLHVAPATGPASVSEGGRGLPLPAFSFLPATGGEAVALAGWQSPEALRAAAVEAGARPGGPARPDVLGALRRFGRMAPAEVAAVCDLAPPRAEADLAALALEWRVRPVAVLGGRLWELA